MTYWPGTNTHKSHGNAFDWRAGRAEPVQREMTARQRRKAATRVNPESTLDKKPLQTAAKQAKLKKGRSI